MDRYGNLRKGTQSHIKLTYLTFTTAQQCNFEQSVCTHNIGT